MEVGPGDGSIEYGGVGDLVGDGGMDNEGEINSGVLITSDVRGVG